MEADRPGPGEELISGPPTPPRPAASVILVRGGDSALEVLLVQRTPAARFMGGAWVFPGGAVDPAEAELETDDAAHRAAAVRELAEEVGVALGDVDALVPFSRWITPEEVTIRYDARFYLALAPAGVHPTVDGAECVAARWLAPADALAAHAGGELVLVFPTIKHLEQLGAFESATALLGHARGREVTPVQPRVLTGGESARIVLPGEPGYDERGG